ncbi:hypothetical protein D9M68_397450 [compost metagenome]
MLVICGCACRIRPGDFPGVIEITQAKGGSRFTPFGKRGQNSHRRRYVANAPLPVSRHFCEPHLGAHASSADGAPIVVLREGIVWRSPTVAGVEIAKPCQRSDASLIDSTPIVEPGLGRIGWHDIPTGVEITQKKGCLPLAAGCKVFQFNFGSGDILRHASAHGHHFCQPDLCTDAAPSDCGTIVFQRTSVLGSG